MNTTAASVRIPQSQAKHPVIDPSAPEIPRDENSDGLITGVSDTKLARVSTILIGVVVAFAVLDMAQDFFAPVVAALVMGIVLSPLTRIWARLHFRPSLAALASLVVVVLALAALAVVLEPYVTSAIGRAPTIWRELESAFRGVLEMMRGLDEITEDVAKTVASDSTQAAGAATGGAAAAEEPVVPSLTDALFYAPTFLAQFMIFAGTLYFFLLAKDEVYRAIGSSLERLTPSDFEKAERRVAKYVITITTINAIFAVIVASVMHALGMPAAPFWGLLAFVLNFVLYLGPIFMAATLLISGIVVFDGAYSIAPAFLYMAMNTVEGQFVTPAFVGHQMKLSPLLVFLSLVFWLWLWGPIGGIIAIPLMIWTLTISKGALRD